MILVLATACLFFSDCILVLVARYDVVRFGSYVSRSAHPRIWYSSLADLSLRIDAYSVVIGSARRSEFLSKLPSRWKAFVVSLAVSATVVVMSERLPPAAAARTAEIIVGSSGASAIISQS